MTALNTPTEPASAIGSRFLRPEEAAAILGKRTTTLAGWRSAGTGPVFHKIMGSVVYFEADIEAFIAAGRHAPASHAA